MWHYFYTHNVYFGLLNYSVSWLRTCGAQKSRIPAFKKSLKEGNPVVVYHTGVYINRNQELDGERAVKRRVVWE